MPTDAKTVDTVHVPRDSERRRHTALRAHVFGPAGVTTVALPASGVVTIGRGSSAELSVDDASVSRRHALLHIGAALELEDLASANGTWIHQRRLEPNTRVELRLGDVVDVGTVMVVIQPADGRPVAAARGASSGAGGAMHALNRLVEKVAASGISVLIHGETGAGKEVCAQTIHRLSARSAQPFLGLNCAALSEQLLESELFGYERGAFTGAVAAKPGLFETADKGTIFLDEIGEMPPTVQARLLRVLETRQLMRVGGTQVRAFDVRFISATHRDLEAEVEAGRFRRDLFYRLAAFSITIPPLRERRDEIATLAPTFVAEACARDGRSAVPELSAAALAALGERDWPGNIRELRNVIDRAVVLCGSGPIRPEHVPAAKGSTASPPLTSSAPASRAELKKKMTEVEVQEIVDALAKCGGNQTRAAELLGVSRRTLVKRLSQHKLPRPRSPKRR